MQSEELNSILRRADYNYTNTESLLTKLKKTLAKEENKDKEDIDLDVISSAIDDVDNSIAVTSPKTASCEIFKSIFDDIITSYEDGQDFAKKMAKDYNLPENEVLQKHKQDFIEKLKDRELGLEVTASGGNKFHSVLPKFVSTHYHQHPEIVTIFLKDLYSHYFYETIYDNGMTHSGRSANYEVFCSMTHFLDNPTTKTKALCDDIEEMIKQDHRVARFALNSADIVQNGASRILKEVFELNISKMQNDSKYAQTMFSRAITYGGLTLSNAGDFESPKNKDVADLILMHMKTFIDNKISLGIELEQHDFITNKNQDRKVKEEIFNKTENSQLYSWLIPEVISKEGVTYQAQYNKNIDILNKITLENDINKKIAQIAQNNPEHIVSTSNNFKL